MLLLLVALVGAPFQDSDTTVAVKAGSRLKLDNFEGAVSVTTWNRSAIRIQGTHDDDTRVNVDVRGTSVSVRGQTRYGPAEVSYRITVPADMSLEISTHSGDVQIDGVKADIDVQTVEGVVRVTGGNGRISLQSVDGEITLAGATGRIEINALDGEVSVRDCKGDLQITSTDG